MHAGRYRQSITKADVNAELDRLEEVDRTTTAGTELPLLLVIDDNADIRRMIGELLKDEYNIVTAPDGREGVRLAAKYVPDLIICDVMMPVMDGLECCRIIKDEVSTSHIPVLMLTACSMDEQRARGYDSGADGCHRRSRSTARCWKSRCRNLIDNRKRIKNLWSSNGGGDVRQKERNASVPVNDIDSEFYSKVLDIMKKGDGKSRLECRQSGFDDGAGTVAVLSQDKGTYQLFARGAVA